MPMTERRADQGIAVLPARFVRFALAGLLSTALQYAVLVAGVRLFHAAAGLSSDAGFLVSVGVNYLLNYHLTFRSIRPHRSAMRRYALVAGAGFAINALLMQLLTVHWHVYYLMAQVGTSLLVLLWNFLWSLFWSFAEPPGPLPAMGDAR